MKLHRLAQNSNMLLTNSPQSIYEKYEFKSNALSKLFFPAKKAARCWNPHEKTINSLIYRKICWQFCQDLFFASQNYELFRTKSFFGNSYCLQNCKIAISKFFTPHLLLPINISTLLINFFSLETGNKKKIWSAIHQKIIEKLFKIRKTIHLFATRAVIYIDLFQSWQINVLH